MKPIIPRQPLNEHDLVWLRTLEKYGLDSERWTDLLPALSPEQIVKLKDNLLQVAEHRHYN